MAKLYFQENDARCYDLQYHKDYMIRFKLVELELFEAKRELGTGYFWCKMFEGIFESGEPGVCGKVHCSNYIPNNGKSGRCKHYGYCYEQTGKTRILKNRNIT